MAPFAATTTSHAATSWHPAAAASCPAETPATTGTGDLNNAPPSDDEARDYSKSFLSPENVLHEFVAGVEDAHVVLEAALGGELLQVVAGGEDGTGGAEDHAADRVVGGGLRMVGLVENGMN